MKQRINFSLFIKRYTYSTPAMGNPRSSSLFHSLAPEIVYSFPLGIFRWISSASHIQQNRSVLNLFWPCPFRLMQRRPPVGHPLAQLFSFIVPQRRVIYHRSHQ